MGLGDGNVIMDARRLMALFSVDGRLVRFRFDLYPDDGLAKVGCGKLRSALASFVLSR